ncbi:MAG: DUF3467 domain-containing protein [Patescibacteria group bacterium]|jgi:hypothetical protein
MNGQPQQQQQNIQIKIDDATMRGQYANMMSVAHSKEEFVLDFMNIYPIQRAGIVNARVIVSPGHLKRIVNALKENLEKYEKAFGTIEEAKAPSGEELGFHA